MSDVARPDVFITDAGCPGHPYAILCDTFDDGPMLQGWSSVSLTDGGTLELSDGAWVSPPLSLLAGLPSYAEAGSLYNSASAALVLDVPMPLDKVRSTYDVYFDSFGEHAATIGGVYLVNGFTSYGLTLFAHSNSMAIEEDGAGDLPDGGSSQVVHYFTPSIPGQTWTRLILDIDFVGSDGGGPSYTLTVESPPGTPATPFAPVPITVTLTGAASTQVFAGVNYEYPLSVTPWRVYVDNVIIEAPP